MYAQRLVNVKQAEQDVEDYIPSTRRLIKCWGKAGSGWAKTVDEH